MSSLCNWCAIFRVRKILCLYYKMLNLVKCMTFERQRFKERFKEKCTEEFFKIILERRVRLTTVMLTVKMMSR